MGGSGARETPSDTTRTDGRHVCNDGCAHTISLGPSKIVERGVPEELRSSAAEANETQGLQPCPPLGNTSDRIPPQRGLFLEIHMGDGQWELVLEALFRRGTERHRSVAKRIDTQLQEMRRRTIDREARRG